MSDLYDRVSDRPEESAYRLRGGGNAGERGENTDVAALQAGYVTVTPVQLELTDPVALRGLNRRQWRLPQPASGEL
jgi:broad specificity polyphosphatase/5'/3'-nucleotidase SurE